MIKHKVTITIDQSGDHPAEQIPGEQELAAYILEAVENRERVEFGGLLFAVDVDAGVTVEAVQP